jgi:DNA ligase (NAD+)
MLAERQQLPFAVDGIVVKVDDLSLRQQLGESSREPLWAAAWKFPPATAVTVVREIRWQVGRMGRRTPVALVDPVILGGIRVRRVSLHTKSEVKRLGVAAGDQAVVALVGDVIPRILEVVKDGASPGSREMGTSVRLGTDGDVCFKDSPGCRDRFLSRAVYFTSKKGCNLAGLGRGRLNKLMDAGLVKDLPSIFRLASEESAVASLLGVKTAARISHSIRIQRQQPPFRILSALGIPAVGPAASKWLAQHFTTLDALLAAEEEQVAALPKCSAAARTVRSFFATPQGKELMQGFRELDIW